MLATASFWQDSGNQTLPLRTTACHFHNLPSFILFIINSIIIFNPRTSLLHTDKECSEDGRSMLFSRPLQFIVTEPGIYLLILLSITTGELRYLGWSYFVRARFYSNLKRYTSPVCLPQYSITISATSLEMYSCNKNFYFLCWDSLQCL